MNSKLIIGFIVATIIIVFGGAYLALKMSQGAQVEKTDQAKAVVEPSSHDWGDIEMKDGPVEAEYTIKNEGSQTLKLYNVKTSCACTIAQFIKGDQQSEIFSMHSQSDYVMEIAPGEKATLKATFDPAFHGPSGVGSITRQVFMETNQLSKPQLSVMATANVVN